jgi:tetratricopeptide (TPR) repeat protein
LEDAIASYDQALEFEPDYDLAWYNKALALYRLERMDKAIFCLDKVLHQQPCLAEAWIHRGNALYALGLEKEARANHRRAQFLSPDPIDLSW